MLEEELHQTQDKASPKEDQTPSAITRARARKQHQQLKDGLMIQIEPIHEGGALITRLQEGESSFAAKETIEPITYFLY